MEKKSPGKYFLVFEPSDVYHQYAVTFTPSCDVQVTKIKKYTDLNYKTDKPVKKNLLGDIDRILTPCTDTSEFFVKYVDPAIFSYDGYNLHNMFIAYKNDGNIKTLKCAINNPKLNSKLPFIDGSKFTDQVSIKGLISFATDPVSSNDFLNFVGKTRKKYETGLSSDTYTMLQQLRYYKKTLENRNDTGVLKPSIILSDKIAEKLSSYKEYRELYLLRQLYKDEKEKERLMLEDAKQKLEQQKKNPYILNEKVPTGQQLNLFGEVVEHNYQKSKKR